MAEHAPVPTPHRAVYGFAFFIFFKTLFILYLFWAFVPDYIIEEQLGLTYLPNKYFALIIPILVLCAITTFGFVIYPSWNLSMQHDVGDVNTIHDCYSLNRCRYLNDDHSTQVTSFTKTCDRKINSNAGDMNNVSDIWHREEFCDLHSNHTTMEDGMDRKWSGIRNITNFCDCSNKSECVLSKNPKHIDVLHKRKMVPNISDMDIADVCKQLFRNRR